MIYTQGLIQHELQDDRRVHPEKQGRTRGDRTGNRILVLPGGNNSCRGWLLWFALVDKLVIELISAAVDGYSEERRRRRRG